MSQELAQVVEDGTKEALVKRIGDESKTDEKKEDTIPDLGGTSKVLSEYGSEYWHYKLFGSIFAFGNGCGFTTFGLLFKEILDALIYAENKQKKAEKVVYYFIIVGFGTLICSIFQYGLFGSYAHYVGVKLRKEYFKILLNQEVSYHDENSSGSLNDKLVNGVKSIEMGIGSKYGFFLQQLFSTLVGVAIAFYYSWKMTLVLIACLPALVIGGFIQGLMFKGIGDGKTNPFSKASAFSYDCLVGITTIISSPLLLKSKVKLYDEYLSSSYPISVKRATLSGASIGILMLMLFGCVYSVGLWYGATLVDKNKLDIDDMFGCFFSFLIAGMALGQMGSVGGDIQKAKLASNEFLFLRDRKANILIGKEISNSDKKLDGNIEFKNVSFSYNNNDLVLDNISFNIKSGQHIAIVGPSGSGKSTIINLLMRFYDPLKKENGHSKFNSDIFIDNEKIEDYNINYYRNNIGYVSQLPLLFDTSIKNNIKGGNNNISEQDIIDACKRADCHDFITSFKNGYDTKVGEMGNKLSGGQKQRISIARAIVTKPSILLFDEATSALDTKSEKEVQKALDKIALHKNQTIITVAHRLSTIKNCDLIIVLVDGQIDEIGTHDELISNYGVYSALVQSQALIDHNSNGNNGNNDNNTI